MIRNNKKANIYFYLLVLITIVGFWELLGSSSRIRLLLSTPSKIIQYLFIFRNDLAEALVQTSFESVFGIVIATALSFFFMSICFFKPRMLGYILPVLAISQVVPLVTLAPLFILLFGIGFLSKLMMTTLICFFPIFIGFVSGVRQISGEVETLLYVYNASVPQRIRWAYLPQSLPHIMAGLKVASTLSVIGAIVAEFNGAEIGLGKNLFIAAKKLEPELMMNSLLLSSILGGSLFGFVTWLERKLGRWYIRGVKL